MTARQEQGSARAWVASRRNRAAVSRTIAEKRFRAMAQPLLTLSPVGGADTGFAQLTASIVPRASDENVQVALLQPAAGRNCSCRGRA
jgi:hypothetical protein